MTPIHAEVQRSLMRASLGQILYKTNDLSSTELKTRMTQALATYGRAETGLRALEPPGSLVRDHERYVTAVRLLQESAVEGLKMFKDGKDDHLLAAYPKSQEASDLIREVGGKFWPNEFPAELRKGGVRQRRLDREAVLQQVEGFVRRLHR
jgi:hypothetical protein